MKQVRAKKHLGQHFLNDEDIARNIVESLGNEHGYNDVLEIGPGMGVLTKYLVNKDSYTTTAIDIDKESIAYLKKEFPQLKDHIIEGDFLHLNMNNVFAGDYAIIGNFPYNISSQIFFKVLDERSRVKEVVCMLQKEVAVRIASPAGNRASGILSIFLQAYYDIEYLFTVEPEVFNPPPKVKSAVIRLVRNDVEQLECDEKWFRRLVKQGFQNRRKTLRNALKPLNLPTEIQQMEMLSKRAEQLSVDDFVYLTQLIQK